MCVYKGIMRGPTKQTAQTVAALLEKALKGYDGNNSMTIKLYSKNSILKLTVHSDLMLKLTHLFFFINHA